MAERKNFFRDSKDVQSVMMRMGVDYVAALDELCTVNDRSRREIVEILIDEAYQEYLNDKNARINPI